MSRKKKLILSALTLFITLLTGYFLFFSEKVTLTVTKQGVFIPKVKTAQLQDIFKSFNYNLIHQIEGKSPVPRLYTTDIPIDFNKKRFDDVRPALFFEMLLPVILKANNKLLSDRQIVLDLRTEFETTGDLTKESMTELTKWIKLYDVKMSDDISTLFDNLIPRVDAVNPTLLLTMAAEDSGLGTSKYARNYNSLFNQKDWDGKGVLPDEPQKEGPQYRIKVFDSIYDALISHIHYINTSGYLENYRIAREKYRRTNNQMRGYSIAHLLINFPYKPFKYPDIIKHLIIQYNLTPLDFLSLEELKEKETTLDEQ